MTTYELDIHGRTLKTASYDSLKEAEAAMVWRQGSAHVSRIDLYSYDYLTQTRTLLDSQDGTHEELAERYCN